MTQFSLDSWKAWAIADAEHRGVNGLEPILDALATSTARLRATTWQPAPDAHAVAPTPEARDDDQ